MKPLNLLTLGGVALAVAVAGFLTTDAMVTRGLNPILISYLIPAILVLCAAGLLWAGWHVRRLKARKTTWMRPLTAMRVALAARAAATVASGCTGLGAGIALAALQRMDATTMAAAARDGLITAGGALILTVCAVIVERWCLIDSDGDGDGDTGLDRAGMDPVKG